MWGSVHRFDVGQATAHETQTRLAFNGIQQRMGHAVINPVASLSTTG